MPASDSKNASADFVYKFLSNLLTTQSSETKLMDYEIGRNVHALLVNLGFTEVKSEGTSLIRYGGDLWSKSLITVWRAAYNIVANKLSTERRKTAEEAINKYIEYLNDPTFYYLTNPLCCAWGRKPKQ
jgi:hypothetical protein